MKLVLSLIASAIGVFSYIPYIRDVLKRKTEPHLYTWILWSILDIVLVALMIKGQAGFAIIPMLVFTVTCFTVAGLALNLGTRNITFTDKIVALFSLLGIIFWLLVDQPLIALLFVITADLLAFVPTVRKTWIEPQSETLSMYVLLAIRFILVLLAVEEFTLLSTLWVITWIFTASVFSVAIFFRRRLFAEI